MEEVAFGKKLRMARISKGLTQKELSNKLGITSVSISYYENGYKKPTFEKLKSLCKILNLDMNEL